LIMKAKLLLPALLLLVSLGIAQNPGDFDLSLGGTGYVYHGGPDDVVEGQVYYMADGRIVVGGFARHFNDTGFFRIHRYLSNGVLDTSLAHTGMLKRQSPMLEDMGEGFITVLPDAKIMTVSTGTDSNGYLYVHMERFRMDGSPDPGFGTNGRSAHLFSHIGVHSVRILPLGSGKYIVAGDYTDIEFGGFFSARFNADGSLDQSYGTNGCFAVPMGSFFFATDMEEAALDANENLIMMAQMDDTAASGGYSWRLIRVDSSGSQDVSYGSNGLGWIDIMPITWRDQVYGLHVEPTGEVFAVGTGPNIASRRTISLRKYTPAGAPDSSFGNQGRLEYGDNLFSYYPWDALVQAEGKILVAGSAESVGSSGETSRFFVACFLPDGTPDSSFGVGGIAALPMGAPTQGFSGHSINLQQDGKILVGGEMTWDSWDTSYFAVARYYGTLQTSVEVPLAPGLLLYPNPAGDHVVLEYPCDGQSSSVEIMLMDAMGRTIKVEGVDGSKGSRQILDVSALPAATYFVQVSLDGKTYQARLVVLH
jgi:uncharacterized delta-60 repeat protein